MEHHNYTPAALASRINEAAVIFSRFVLLSSSYGDDAIYCFVEGYDMPYYRSIIYSVCRKEPIEINDTTIGEKNYCYKVGDEF